MSAPMVPKRYIIQTFGCQMNVHDSRRIDEVLGQQGYTPTEEAGLADVVIINTCSVREKAEHKLMSLLGTFRGLKESRPDLVLAVAGCVAQQEGERLLRKVPFVDLVMGPDNIVELPELLVRLQGGEPPIVRTVFDNDQPHFMSASPQRIAREVTGYVTVMKGCDERCTFCVVPYTRGSERYRPADEIVAEIAARVAGGVREVTLLGQTVNSWFDPSAPAKLTSRVAESGSKFAGLLRRIAREVPALTRLRYTSPHPRHVTPELIAAHAELRLLAAHVHLPVQSGSDRVLKRMARRYKVEHYIDRARALCAARPGLTLSTDIIVGFPGETEDDFEATLELVQTAGFVAAFGFKYSPRPFTPALKLGDDVPEEVKDERLARLFELVDKQQSAHLGSLVGTTQHVLIEGPSRQGERYTGRTERHEIVHVSSSPEVDPTGEVVEVLIDQAYGHSLGAAMAGAPQTPLGRVRSIQLPLVGEGAA